MTDSTRTRGPAEPLVPDIPFVDAPYIPSLLERHPGLILRGVVDPKLAKTSVERLLELTDEWGDGPVEDEHNFGKVFYAHAMNGNIDDYFAHADQVNASMESQFPELLERVRQFLHTVLRGESVVLRPGWTGPSFVRLGPRSISSREGGTIHIDWEAFDDWGHPKTAPLLADRSTVAYSVIFMLQSAPEGGGLKIWDYHYDPDRRAEFIPDPEQPPPAPSAVHRYGVGDVAIVRSFSMHQIQPYSGDARITLNFFLLRQPDGWHMFF